MRSKRIELTKLLHGAEERERCLQKVKRWGLCKSKQRSVQGWGELNRTTHLPFVCSTGCATIAPPPKPPVKVGGKYQMEPRVELGVEKSDCSRALRYDTVALRRSDHIPIMGLEPMTKCLKGTHSTN